MSQQSNSHTSGQEAESATLPEFGRFTAQSEQGVLDTRYSELWDKIQKHTQNLAAKGNNSLATDMVSQCLATELPDMVNQGT